MRRWAVILIGLFLLAAVGSPARAQVGPLPQAANWELDRLALTDGNQVEGLLLSEKSGRLEFVEIRRRPGQPMQATIRRLDPSTVARKTLLEGKQRQRLLKRYRLYRNRVRIELGRMEAVKLDRADHEGVEYLVFRGDGFGLWSAADEEMTRRCVVRIEQIMRAYQQLLPPRAQRAGASFRVLLYGSMDDYRGYLQRLGLNIDNPAFYSAPKNIIVAGSDLTRYADRLEQIRAENAALIRRYDQVLNPQFDNELARLSKELRRRGLPLDEIGQRRAAWDREYRATLRRIKETDRRNESKFAQVTQRMFVRLNHEAFHAYLENHVYPHRTHDTPRWLNEGLAQIFEGGIIEADTLRVDAADPARLAQLQRDLSDNPLPLAQLLKSEERHFLAAHLAAASQRRYVYSWGLAYYLTFYEDLLGRDELEWYVSPEAARLDPIARFERLVGDDLPRFESRWRYAMQAIKQESKDTPK